MPPLSKLVHSHANELSMGCLTNRMDADKALLLLVVFFDRNGVINWDKVTTHLSPSKSLEEVRNRLEYLTHEDTTVLHQLPASYVEGSSLSKYHTTHQTQIFTYIDDILGHITKADVRQPSGKGHFNAGEIAIDGVTAMLDSIHLTSQDTFLDVGSGTGNVVAQVALDSPVQSVIGLEIRSDLAKKSKDAIQSAMTRYPRLNAVEIVNGDIKNLSSQIKERMHKATILFCNNQAFEPEDNLGLRKFISSNSNLQSVLLTQQLCSRCSPLCGDLFCLSWKLKKVITTRTCWRVSHIKTYVYIRISLLTNNIEDLLSEV